MNSYKEFIRAKHKTVARSGFECKELNPRMKRWQADLVRWLCRIGRGGDLRHGRQDAAKRCQCLTVCGGRCVGDVGGVGWRSEGIENLYSLSLVETGLSRFNSGAQSTRMFRVSLKQNNQSRSFVYPILLTEHPGLCKAWGRDWLFQEGHLWPVTG